MYQCHLCSLISNSLSGLMTAHYKKHISNSLSKEEYKNAVLIHNGRSPRSCDMCGVQLPIYGIKRKNRLCYKCNLARLTDDRYKPAKKTGKTRFKCAECGETCFKYKTQLNGKNYFCSTVCSVRFYWRPENQSDRFKAALEKRRQFIGALGKSDKRKAARAATMALLSKNRRSKKEEACFQLVKSLYPDAESSYLVKHYIFDIYIPSLNTIIEFDGTYWHSLKSTKSLDRRKENYLKKYHPNKKLIRISEEIWDTSQDRVKLIKDLLQ